MIKFKRPFVGIYGTVATVLFLLLGLIDSSSFLFVPLGLILIYAGTQDPPTKEETQQTNAAVLKILFFPLWIFICFLAFCFGLFSEPDRYRKR